GSVSRLGLAWSYDVGQGGGNQEATPLFWNGGLYGITNWSVVFAVDARTGKERWRWDPEVNQTAVRPKICCGVVNRGIAIYQGKIIAPVIDGRLEALDAETGKPVWDGMAYDPDADLIYVGTGNGGPWPEELRQSKGKDNLFVCSILAVRPDTGELKWYYQPVPGDSWDYDSVQGFILADLTINGRQRKVLMQANKDGFYYVLDRLTGAFISAQPFALVTWAKGIDPETGRPIINPEAHYDQNGETITLAPGPGGAHNWSPMSFNPTTG